MSNSGKKQDSSEKKSQKQNFDFKYIFSYIKDLPGTVQRKFDNIYRGKTTSSIYLDRLINAVKVAIVSTKKFLEDDCFTKASSIAYTAAISFIPMLTVVLWIYTYATRISTDQAVNQINKLVIEYNLSHLNLSFIFPVISGLINNASKIGGIGLAVLIVTATSMLRSVEKSLNDIWNVKKSRPIYLKIVYYWATLTLGPILIATGAGLSSTITKTFTPPSNNAAIIQEQSGTIWVAADKAKIFKINTNKEFKKPESIQIQQIDFINQKNFEYDFEQQFFKRTNTKIEPLTLNKYNLQDIQFIKDRGWAVGSDGLILHTVDRGESWKILQLGSFDFNRIYMLNRKKGFIAADKGFVLTTNDGGTQWQVRQMAPVTTSFNDIFFTGQRGFICGTKGILMTTDNLGETWSFTRLAEAKKNKNWYIHLNKMYLVNNTLWILGDEGTIFKSTDMGQKWQKIKFMEYDYYSAVFNSSTDLYVSGNKGAIAHTKDGGQNWTVNEVPGISIQSLLKKDKKLWVFGDAGLMMFSKDNGETWNGRDGTSTIIFVLNFIAPFILIWLFFLLVYSSMPNTRIPVKYASIGAAFTSAIWVLFILAFVVYVKAFASGTFAIYGALVSIPLSLLIVYTTAAIVLFGAEVSCTLMHPETYKDLRKGVKNRADVYAYYGIMILEQIYKKFETGKGESSFKDILKASMYNTEQADFFINLFLTRNLILHTSSNGYLPARRAEALKINYVLETVLDVGLEIPGSVKNNIQKNKVKEIFSKIKNARQKAIGELTMKDFIG